MVLSSAIILPLLLSLSTVKLIDAPCTLAPPSAFFVLGAKYNVGTKTVSVFPFGNTTDLLTNNTTSSLRLFCSANVNSRPKAIDCDFVRLTPASINLRYCSSAVKPDCNLFFPV